MNDREFNLIDERWIRVIWPDCREEEVSLIDALINAHEYQDLSGELPTQDVAILRLLLAILHTVFTRVDENGEEAPFDYPSDARNRWKALWKMGHFPKKPILDYLNNWHERFWLFHPDRPFYQVNEASIGTENGAFKLNGELSQSNNKERLFTTCAGEYKERMSYPEAARWLIYLNGFDDTSAKPKGKNLPTPGIGWLGKLGLITAVGHNLFETLMMNMVLLPEKELWEGREQPCWELPAPRTGERVQISMPDNAAGLLTLQSRRILLKREDDKVVGYALLGGDFFPKEDALMEQMTVWSEIKDKNGNHQHFQPRRHDASKQMWRDFGAIAGMADGHRRPGVVAWVDYLRYHSLLPKGDRISFRIASVQYGDKDFFVNNVFGDQLTFHTELLTEAGKLGYDSAIEEIKKCEKAAQNVGLLAKNLYAAAGGRGESDADAMKAQYFDMIDAPFRKWLSELEPDDVDELHMQCEKWQGVARQTALNLGRTMIERAGESAFIGRKLEDKKKKQEDKKGKAGDKKNKSDSKSDYHVSSPEAYKWFVGSMYKLYPDKKDDSQEVNTNG